MEETKGWLRKITFFRELDKEGIYYSEVLNSYFSIFKYRNISIFTIQGYELHTLRSNLSSRTLYVENFSDGQSLS